jgi:hypothetical protein
MNLWLNIISWAIKNSYYYTIDYLGNDEYRLTCRSAILLYHFENSYPNRLFTVKEIYNPNEFDFK